MSTQNVVYGYVASGGTPISGSADFKVDKDPDKDGIYTISFNKSFTDQPAVVATVETNESSPSGQARIATINNISNDGFQVFIQGGSGTKRNEAFSFIAMGV